MKRLLSWATLGLAAVALLSACGGGSNDGGDGSPDLTSSIGASGVFAAWLDPDTNTYDFAPMGSYAGKRQVMRGTVDFTTGADLSQPAGLEIYKGDDGHIYELDLTASGEPEVQQVSNETSATVDDTCSLTGTQVAGASYDYAGVYFAADLQNPVNSSYFYRLPGPDSVCNTPDDIVQMVKTGMSATDAPVTVSGMPVATVRTALGGISGFVVKSGAQLVLVDGDFANPVVLGTFSSPIGVASALPVGLTQGYPGGQLFVVDGAIVFVDYAARTVSASLFTIPNWKTTNAGAHFAASPSTLYFSINTAATHTTPASTSIYAMPADGSSAPMAVDTEPGRIDTLVFPIAGSNLVWGVVNSTYAVRTMAQTGGAVTTLAGSAVNAGTFTATATTVYYTTWQNVSDSTAKTVTRSSTSSGIVGINGTVLQAPLANSMFAGGGEQYTFPDDTTTTTTPYETILQVRGLSPVTVADNATGYTYTADGVSGGTLIALDAATSQPIATIGTLPTGTAMFLTGSLRDADHNGFIEAYTSTSTNDPATRDLYLLNARSSDSLMRVTDNL